MIELSSISKKRVFLLHEDHVPLELVDLAVEFFVLLSEILVGEEKFPDHVDALNEAI